MNSQMNKLFDKTAFNVTKTLIDEISSASPEKTAFNKISDSGDAQKPSSLH